MAAEVRSPWRVILASFLLLVLSSWYLDASQNDNITSRAATVAALVEQGTFRIDRYQELTGDKAFYNGHYGLTARDLLGVILYAVGIRTYWLRKKTAGKSTD